MGAGATTLNTSQLTERHVTKEQVPKDVLAVLNFDKLCRKTDNHKTAISYSSASTHDNKTLSIYELISQYGKLTDVYLSFSSSTTTSSSSAPSSIKKDSHQQLIKSISNALIKKGLRTWMMNEENSFNVNMKVGENRRQLLAKGIDRTRLVLLFITKRYMEKINGNDESDSNKLEFKYATSKRNGKQVLAIVLEEELRDSNEWTGLLGSTLGTSLHLDLTELQEPSGESFEHCVDELYGSILTRIGRSLDDIAQSIDWQQMLANSSEGPEVPSSAKGPALESKSTSKLSVKKPPSIEEMILWFVDHVKIPYTVGQVYAQQLSEEGVHTIAQLIKKLITNSSFLDDFDIFDTEDILEIKVQMQLSDGAPSTQPKPGKMIIPSTINCADDVVDYLSVAKHINDDDEHLSIHKKCIAIMDKKRSVNEQIGQQEGCKLIARLIKHFVSTHSSKDIIVGLLQMMCILSRFDTNIKESTLIANVELLGWFGACECIHNIMTEYGKDETVALLACVALRNLAANHKNNQINFGFNGTCEEIISLMNFHSKSAEIMQQSFGAVWNLCGNLENQTKLGAYGICDIMKKALRQHMANAKVVEVTFGCIRNLIYNNNDNKTRFGATGMCEVLTIALSTHNSNTEVVKQGCGAIWGLASLRSNKQKFFESDVCDVICLVLASFVFNPEVMEQACGAIWSLATGSELIKDKFKSCGVCESLSKVLSTHMDESAVAETVCGAIMVLCANKDDIKGEFKNLGIIELLDRASKLHFNHQMVVNNVQSALKNLSTSTPKRVQSVLDL